MNVEQAARVAKQGDILLIHYKHPDIISDSIEWFEGNGYVSHACMALDSLGRIIQATSKDGVIISSIAEFAPEEVDIVVRRTRADQVQLNAMVVSALSRLGKPYGFWQAAWDGFCLLMSKLGIRYFLKFRSPVPRSESWTCSTLISMAAEDARYDLDLDVPHEDATPEDLLTSTAMDTVSA